MDSQLLDHAAAEIAVKKHLGRRSFFTKIGFMGLGTASLAALTQSARADTVGKDDPSGDTAQQIFTAALIAEDLATTFYYNVLVGPVLTNVNLAGTDGTATMIGLNGNPGNVEYLQAALIEEINHANLLRSLIGGAAASGDPVQTFYFPAAAFSDFSTFLTYLNALESAFIGAYLNATLEFAQMATDTQPGVAPQRDYAGTPYTAQQLQYFAEVAASIMGVEAEHRVLGNVIGNVNPANNLNYQQTDGLTSVYNGPHSAVVALTPFLTPGNGAGYSLATALAGAAAVIGSVTTTGAIPPYPPAVRNTGKGH